MDKDPTKCKYGNLWDREGRTKCNFSGRMVRTSGSDCEGCQNFKDRILRDKTNGKPIKQPDSRKN